MGIEPAACGVYLGRWTLVDDEATSTTSLMQPVCQRLLRNLIPRRFNDLGLHAAELQRCARFASDPSWSALVPARTDFVHDAAGDASRKWRIRNAAHFALYHLTSGGRLMRYASGSASVPNPNCVPRSYTRLNST